VIHGAQTSAPKLALEIESELPQARRVAVAGILNSVEVSEGQVSIRLGRIALASRLLGATEAQVDDNDITELTVTVQLTRHGMVNRLVVEGTQAPRASGASDEPLIRAIACGRAWFEELASGRAASFGKIAERVGVTDRYVSRIVDLAFLAPDVVEAVLNGEQAADVTVRSLTVVGSLPILWDDQRRTLGLEVR
jgi:hypothetical protein